MKNSHNIFYIIIVICLLLPLSSKAQTIFSDDFEGGLGNWANDIGNPVGGDFNIQSTYYNGASNALYNSSTNNSSTHIIEQTANMDFTGGTSISFSFYHIAQTEGTYDKCYIEISEDGGATYTALPGATYNGSSDYATRGYFHEDSYNGTPDWQDNGSPTAPGGSWWVKEVFDLTSYSGQNDIRIRFRYTTDIGTEEWGWAIDDILILNNCNPTATFTQTCNTDLTYTLDVNISDLNGATSVQVDSASTTIQSGIGSTGTYSYSSQNGTTLYEVIDESDASCKADTTIDACTACGVLDVSFGPKSDCKSDLTFDIDITINSIADGESVKITDGTLDLLTGITDTGTYTISDIFAIDSVYFEVIDENDPTCTISSIKYICDACALTSSPTNEPCSAPSVDLSQPFYGSTSCGYDVSGGGNGPDDFCASSDNDSWLKFKATSDTVVLDWEVLYDSTDCDDGVQFAVFDGNCFDQDAMVNIACRTPDGVSFEGTGRFTIPDGSFGSYPLTIGKEYYIYIDGYAGDLCNYNWEPVSGVAITPPNDTCPSASNVSCGYTDTASIVLSTSNDAPASCGGLSAGKGNWYLYAGNNDSLVVSTDNNGTNFDTEILIYTGSCGALTCLASDNDGGTGTTSELRIQTTSGTNYYIYIDGNGTSEGQYEVSFDCITAAPCNANAGTWD